MESLFEKLKEHGESDIYPYHMPGHKRQSCGQLPEQIYKCDITEIDGFDNLHQPEGILLELQRKAALLYGAEESFYLVNGSTCGILTAISSALPMGGHILMARNCHKSAYHGAYLRNLTISYLYPPYLEEYDICGAVTPKQVRDALEQEPDIGAVLIVSPTYEGCLADVGEIAEIVHAKNIPLIVDEAHGAHLGLADGFAKNSCQAGADLVIHSVHKTLPALTQTALLHVSGELIDREGLRRFLHIYQSSSPSYLLMASIDNALHFVETEGQRAFGQFKRQYQAMIAKLSACKCLKFFPADWNSHDVGKLLISVKDTNYNGKQLYDTLLHEYHLQLEMAAESYALAMFTVNDGEEACRRMTQALLEIDCRLSRKPAQVPVTERGQDAGQIQRAEQVQRAERVCEQGQVLRSPLPLHKAWDLAAEWAALEECAGRIAGEFVNLYPPGIPLLVPGEIITEELCRNILDYLEQGLTVQGVEEQEPQKIFLKILK